MDWYLYSPLTYFAKLLQMIDIFINKENFLVKHGTKHVGKRNARDRFYLHGLTLILAWINNHIHYNVRNEITYAFPNFNGTTIEVWEWIYK